MKKKIKNPIKEKVYLFSSLKTGGINTYCDTLEKSLKSKNYEIIVIKKKIQALKIVLKYLLVFPFKKNNKIRFITWGVYNLLPLPKSSHICIFHGFPSIRQQGFIRFSFNLISLNICKIKKSKAVSVSNYVHSILLDVYGLKTLVIRNSIPHKVLHYGNFFEKKEFENIKKNIDVTFVGRPTKFKLPFQMVKNINYLAKRNYKISIIGESKYLSQIKNNFHRNNINFHGNLDYLSISEILLKTKLIINCSDSEPFGLIYLEGLYNFCHILSPRSGGALEIYSLLSEYSKSFFTFYENLEFSLDILKTSIDKAGKNFEKMKENSYDIRHDIEEKFSIEKQLKQLFSL